MFLLLGRPEARGGAGPESIEGYPNPAPPLCLGSVPLWWIFHH